MSKAAIASKPSGSKIKVGEETTEIISKKSTSKVKVKQSGSKLKEENVEATTVPPKDDGTGSAGDAPVSTENPEGQGEAEEKPVKLTKSQIKEQKRKRKELLNDPLTFKSVDFEHALTDEEKAAKKAARLAKRQAKKKGGDKSAKSGKTPKSELTSEASKPETTEDQKAAGEAGPEAAVEGEEKQEKKEGEGGKEKKKKKVKEKKETEEKEKGEGKKKKKGGKKEKKEGAVEEKKEGAVEEKKEEAAEEKTEGVVEEKKEGEGETVAEGVVEETKEGDEGKKKDKKKKGKKGKDEGGDGSEKPKKGKKKDKKGKKSKMSESAEGEAPPEDEEGGGKKKGKKGKKGRKKGDKGSEAKSSESAVGRRETEEGDVTFEEKRKKTVSITSMETRKRRGKSRSKVSVGKSLSALDAKPRSQRLSKTRELGSSVYGTSSLYMSQTAFEESESSMSIEGAHSRHTSVSKERKGKKKKKGKKGKKEAEEPKEPKEAEEKKEVVVVEKEEKKGKKKKRKKEEQEAPADEPVDIMAQIMKMKQQAELEAAKAAGLIVEEEVKEEEKPKKKKKKKGKKGAPKKKLSKAEKARLAIEMAEQARIQAELDAQRALEEEQKRLIMEKKLAKEKEKKDTAEQALRVEQLSNSYSLINSMLDYSWNINSQEKADFEWEQYLKCDGLPIPTNPAQMNTYLHLWEQVIKDVTVGDAKHRTNEIIELLKVLDEFIDDPFDAPHSLMVDWKWVRALCREHQQESLDMTTYRLLRDIDSRMRRIDIPTADFNIIAENFMLCLWLCVQLATPLYNPRAAIKKRVEIAFPEMRMTVLFPLNLETKCVAIRAIYVTYDHLSDTSSTYDKPLMPPEMDRDLFDVTSKEWYTKMKYKYDKRKPKPKQMVEDEEGNMVELPEEPEPEIPEGEVPPPVPYQRLEPSASEYVIILEDNIYKKNRESLVIEVELDVINLRKFLIIGGIYHLDLFYQPPQPHDLVAFDIRITALQVPKRLEEVPFYIPYAPYTPSEPDVRKTPEQIEEEQKRQDAELDKLIQITLTLPDHVIFLDLPTVCQWDKKRRAWTTQDIYDLKHIEEKNYMTFRTGKFGPFALAVNRYINFPFQAWEIKPEQDGTIMFQLTCAILMVEFNVKNNRICVTQLQNSPNNALQDIVGVYYKLPKLIRILKDGGVDLFPAIDAFCYVENACEKHWPTEKHLYYNMSQMATSYNFAWSRWNAQAGRRNLVLQMREYRLDRAKQRNHSMLLVTPLKANLIETTEVSPTFNDTPLESMKFYSDLYNLMKGTSSMSTKKKLQKAAQDTAKSLSDLLITTRILSFS